ncbi:putative ATP-dependent RNA and DNA helicase, partial [Operophtera brumata]
AGQCSYKTKATEADSGQWRCHIGRKGLIGLEIMQIINVRVDKQLAAIQKNITTVHGKSVYTPCQPASATGITFGAIGIVAFLVVLGVIVWKKRRFLGSMPDEGNDHELQRLPTTPQRSRQGSMREQPRSRQGSIEQVRSRQGLMEEQPRSPGS